MTKSAGLETILTPGRSMRCGIVKMHYRSSRVRISPAVQDMSERLKSILAEVGAVKLCLSWEPLDQDGAADAQEHGEQSFADADRGSHSCGDLVG
jgi:putative N-acetylmannosamine-6-phosphate epimerase